MTCFYRKCVVFSFLFFYSKMANSKIKLTYFNFTGRAECIRLVLIYGGKEFDDCRIPREKWPEIKPTSPFGQVPFVEIDGKAYGQSMAIAKYFARECGLYGETNLDGLRIDQMCMLTDDFIQKVVEIFRESDVAKKAEIEKKVKEEHAPTFLAFLEKLCQESSGAFFLGDCVTLADIVIYDICTGFLRDYISHELDKFTRVKKIAEQVGSNDRIKAYAAKQK